MKESELDEFFRGLRDEAWLTRAARALGDGALVADLTKAVHLSCQDLVRLCDAHLHGGLPAEALGALATAILGSDRLVWDETSLDGELVAEVLWDWSSPDAEDGLSTETIALHRKLLVQPQKPRITSQN